MSDYSQKQHEELVAWLEERGHSPQEVVKILAKVAGYDARTVNESIFDSISSGDFDLAGLIEEALRQ